MFVGFLAFIIVTTVGYTINQGDFFQNEYLFIIAKTFWISLSIAYAKWFDMVSLRRLTKKEILLFIGSFLICVLVNIGYYSFFYSIFWCWISTPWGYWYRNFLILYCKRDSFWAYSGGICFQRYPSRCGFWKFLVGAYTDCLSLLFPACTLWCSFVFLLSIWRFDAGLCL